MFAASWIDIVYEHGLAFGLGVVVGFVGANRYRIVKRNGKEDT